MGHQFHSCDRIPIEGHEEPHGFEGPEKRLSVEFKPNANRPNGMRDVKREQWDELLTFVKAVILSSHSDEHFDSYVLSESSLFVYPTQFMIKTCGTTSLLACLPKLLEYAKELELEFDSIIFSRKNYRWPDRQYHPHCSFEAEVDTLNKFFPNGSAHILGALSGDHWHVYVAGANTLAPREQSIEVMMSDLDPSAMAPFFKSNYDVEPDAKQVTIDTGIAQILPGSFIQEHFFTPCGYSMNGHFNNAYSTIHITPEAGFSFVSYETNLVAQNYTTVLTNALDVFRPGSFSVAVLAGDDAVCGKSYEVISKHVKGYRLLNRSTLEVLGRNITVGNYVRNTV
eukprot:TRINITY_DN546_c0_g1_i1.p1 TRINITY_DN546_c0_g1~~TRINITY_DN546_c0_g1_i1.p1  ORF type:complete len:340 (+),score=161.82 TRINITY_DN546_c0_g1_i1:499-1518(+)